MRTILMTLVVVGLLAAPSFGVINVLLSTNKASINVGETAVISLLGQGTVAGIGAVGGNINATGSGAMSSAGFAWIPVFTSPAPFGSKLGSALANGGWGLFGSQQANYLAMDPLLGKAAPVVLATYTVTGVTPGVVSLQFASGSYGGFKPVETDRGIVLGTLGSVAVTVTAVPEPATMVLLAIGGLLAARRRSH